jgi:hypothetical protein
MDITPDATSAPRDVGRWAQLRETLSAAGTPVDAPGAAIEGRRLSGPIHGFGRMWQKTYRIRLGTQLTPEQVIAHWRAHYGEFWPSGSRFCAPLAGLEPGEVALLQARVGGLRLSTGVLVLYADEVSFAFMTPQGHPFAGIITFSAHRDGSVTVAQVQLLIRAHDPLTELGMALGGHRKEDAHWEATLRALAASLGIDGQPAKEILRVDRKRQWRQFGNIRHDPVLWALRHPRGGKPPAR